MPQGPDWKQLVEAGMHVTELGRSQARQIVADLVAQGHLAQDRATSAVDDVVELSRRRRDELRDFVQAEIRRQVGALGIATKDDLARLEKKLAAATPAKSTRAAKATKAPAAKKSAAKKTTASAAR
jgi:polyhydroxyalkanoate synthesis regulator phasin